MQGGKATEAHCPCWLQTLYSGTGGSAVGALAQGLTVDGKQHSMCAKDGKPCGMRVKGCLGENPSQRPPLSSPERCAAFPTSYPLGAMNRAAGPSSPMAIGACALTVLLLLAAVASTTLTSTKAMTCTTAAVGGERGEGKGRAVTGSPQPGLGPNLPVSALARLLKQRCCLQLQVKRPRSTVAPHASSLSPPSSRCPWKRQRPVGCCLARYHCCPEWSRRGRKSPGLPPQPAAAAGDGMARGSAALPSSRAPRCRWQLAEACSATPARQTRQATHLRRHVGGSLQRRQCTAEGEAERNSRVELPAEGASPGGKAASGRG